MFTGKQSQAYSKTWLEAIKTSSSIMYLHVTNKQCQITIKYVRNNWAMAMGRRVPAAPSLSSNYLKLSCVFLPRLQLCYGLKIYWLRLFSTELREWVFGSFIHYWVTDFVRYCVHFLGGKISSFHFVFPLIKTWEECWVDWRWMKRVSVDSILSC